MDGWFKLHRKITESAIFSDADLLRLWIYCLSKAAYRPTTAIIDKREIHLQPGQFVTGRFSLHSEFNSGVRNSKKVKETTLWSWLKRLESYGNLDIKSYNKYSVVTVVKWNEYQDVLTTEQQQTDNRLTTDCQQNDTIKELKEIKENKEIKEYTHTTDRDDLLNLINELKVTSTVYGLDQLYSFIDVVETGVIEIALKKAAGKHINFALKILRDNVAEGKTTVALVNPAPTVGTYKAPRNHKPDIQIVQNNPDEPGVSDEEMAKLIEMAKEMEAKKEAAERAKRESA